MKFISAALFSLAILLSGPAVNAAQSFENGTFSLGPKVGYLSGDTTYHISQYYFSSGIESELEFPLKTPLAGLNFTYDARNRKTRWGMEFSFSWMLNTGSGSGKVKDSDWATDDVDISEVGSAHPGKDIYSESDVDLKASMVDIHAVFSKDLRQDFSIGPMAGFRYQQFKYNILNVNQIGYGPYAAYTAFVPGLAATYEVTYKIPYVGVSVDFRNRTLNSERKTSLRVAVSPFTKADDRDDHILRSKLSTCSAAGISFLASADTSWNISEVGIFEIRGEYLRIFTDGIQRQYFYGGPYAGEYYYINDEITSEQLLVTAGFTFPFD